MIFTALVQRHGIYIRDHFFLFILLRTSIPKFGQVVMFKIYTLPFFFKPTRPRKHGDALGQTRFNEASVSVSLPGDTDIDGRVCFRAPSSVVNQEASGTGQPRSCIP